MPLNLYKSDVSADDIVIGEWARNRSVEEAMNQLMLNGFMTNKEIIIQTWVNLDERYKI